MKEGITDVDVFQKPFEIQFLRDEKCFNEIKNIVESRFEKAYAIIDKDPKSSFAALKELKLQPLRSILVPKKTLFDFRKCGYIELLDEITYLTLCLTLSNKIEKERIHKRSKLVYSYRLKPDLINQKKPTSLFDSDFTYTTFRKEVSQRAKDKSVRVVVACDIGNFYDRLNLHRLENTLLAVKDIETPAVILLNELLLYWSNRDSYGIPVGSNGSRILAEASLINIDKYLMNKKISFIRFVDDFRLFAKNASQAHTWLSILVERLNQEGLFLNTSKTSISEASKVIRTQFEKPIEVKSQDDSEMEKSDLPLIIRGYSGLIPTKFRKISERERANLIGEDIARIKRESIDIDLIDPKDLLKYIRALVAQENWSELAATCSVLIRFPQFTPYYLDSIHKNESKLEEHKDILIPTIVELANDSNILEYLRIYILRFLSISAFLSKNTVIDSYHRLKRSEGVYLGRAILECLNNIVDRDDLLQIKNDFIRADPAEKRQILKLLKQTFNDNEFSSFYKNISLNDDDIWYSYIASKKQR